MSLYDNGVLNGTTAAKEGTNGWTLPTLADGLHNLSLVEPNPAGETSAPLNVSFTVDTTPPTPVLLGLVERSSGEIMNFGNSGIPHDATPAIVFTAQAGGMVSLYDNGALPGSRTAMDGVNGWDLPPLADGLHKLSLFATNAAGAMSDPLIVNFTVDAATTSPARGSDTSGRRRARCAA
jgi:large repetitive protein